MRALQRRSGISAALATMIGVATMLVVLFAFAAILDTMGLHLPTKLGAAIGLAALAGSGSGAFAILDRALPRRARENTIPWPYVVALRPSESRIQLVTTAPALAGTWTFDVTDARAVVDALEAARRQ